jgi:aminomethyltransferase
MVPFAGYEMPVSYPLGVLKEHLHTREKAGLFDVSHMGQIKLAGSNVARALETLVPVDIIDLPINQQRYALLTNTAGGIIDDLMLTNTGEFLFLVVNAASKVQDIAHMQAHIGKACEMTVLNHALLALQGPAAVTVLARLAPQCAAMRFMTFKVLQIADIACLVTRSGYTGEDGFEISVPAAAAEKLARLLLAQPEVEMIGLGARDSLRLEAGLCLYGQDLDAHTTPIESSLLWAISKVRRQEGARAGGFLGAERILAQIEQGVSKKRVGLIGLERVPVRAGTMLTSAAQKVIGNVSSGGISPTLGRPIALAYLSTPFTAVGTKVFALVRGKQVPMEVVKPPFVVPRYFRG